MKLKFLIKIILIILLNGYNLLYSQTEVEKIYLNDNNKLQKNVEKLKQDSIDLEKKLKDCNDTKGVLDREYKKIKTFSESLENSLDSALKIITDLRAELNRIQKQFKDSVVELAKVRKNLSELTKLIEEYKSIIKKNRNTIIDVSMQHTFKITGIKFSGEEISLNKSKKIKKLESIKVSFYTNVPDTVLNYNIIVTCCDKKSNEFKPIYEKEFSITNGIGNELWPLENMKKEKDKITLTRITNGGKYQIIVVSNMNKYKSPVFRLKKSIL